MVVFSLFFFFFFQAEDGIRDFHVTGVQTCALPIYGAGAGTAAPGWLFRAPFGRLEAMAKRSTERLIADRYTLQRTLGRGGMGVVWRAKDNLLDRDVAVKEVQLPPSLNDEEREAIRARVMREARAAARLNHPNVVTLYDVVREEERTFIVMELVEAPTLAEVVRDRGPLPAAEVAAIGLQLLDALRAAHQVGIVHRDVKPGNVMVPPGEGGAKLADFGIASLAGDPQLTSTGLVLGSPAYMAPEQANGQLSGPCRRASRAPGRWR